MNDGSATRFLTLPEDLILNCLARVSRLYYPTLFLVCKRFRSLVASAELYNIRILLGLTESFLYVSLRRRTDSNLLLNWFVLTNNSKKVLVPIHVPNSSLPPGVAVVGPNIYIIGGGSKNNASSNVMVMDSRFHTCHEAPSMRVARVFPATCVLDGKIYVTGGCDNLDSMNWMEVFDTNTQTWEFLQIPSEQICIGSEYRSVKYEGTVYVMSQKKYVTYKLHKGRWRAADLRMNMGWSVSSSSSYCVIENVFYRYGDRKIYWYDLENRMWITLKGLEGLSRLSFSDQTVQLADYGGKIAILWEEYVSVDENKMIWYGEIALEKRQNGEIWGTLEGFENLLISNGPNCPVGLVHALIATVW